jgi:hypothetical protein
MVLQPLLKNSERFLFPHRVYLLAIDGGKPGSPLFTAAYVYVNAATGDMVDIPGFSGGFPVIKNPADFIFPLRRDKG